MLEYFYSLCGSGEVERNFYKMKIISQDCCLSRRKASGVIPREGEPEGRKKKGLLS